MISVLSKKDIDWKVFQISMFLEEKLKNEWATQKMTNIDIHGDLRQFPYRLTVIFFEKDARTVKTSMNLLLRWLFLDSKSTYITMFPKVFFLLILSSVILRNTKGFEI